MNRSRAFRWWMWGVAAAGVVILAAIALRLALLDGWLRTVRIDGPSMAETLSGTHLEVTCGDCKMLFRADGEHLPESGRLVCPNCGNRELDAGEFPVRTGDSVLLDHWPLLWRAPRRWEVVAYDDPHAAGAAVKRVVGLPGETIAIRGGDLYADGRIVRKTLSEFWQTAVLVHDNDYRPQQAGASSANAVPRWRGDESGWRASDGGFRFEPAGGPAANDLDWLEYVHFRCDASLTPRHEPAAILDNDAYNQAQSRRLNEVHDLLLTCEAELSGGQLSIAIWSREVWLEVMFDSEQGRITASQDGRTLATAAAPRRLTRATKLAAGQFDQQLIVALEGKDLLAIPLELPSEIGEQPAGPNAQQRLKIAASGAATVRHLQVWRDLYLLEPRGTDRDWTTANPLGADEVFVLGDNPPVSIDSRHWQPAGIALDRIRSIVVRPRRSETKRPSNHRGP